jgi:hypothetical protein
MAQKTGAVIPAKIRKKWIGGEGLRRQPAGFVRDHMRRPGMILEN